RDADRGGARGDGGGGRKSRSSGQAGDERRAQAPSRLYGPPRRGPPPLGVARLLRRLGLRTSGDQVREAGQYYQNLAPGCAGRYSGVPRTMNDSHAGPLKEPEELTPDIRAAEYVLGTLGSIEREEAKAMLAFEPAFASLVRDWERRLGELHALA